uniref:Uncharacterized protein n=1 Tax=Phaseolus vulgaris TaxID=3885 RepID=V7CT08_PHAVU|nr:hypothetical protein PHAVU_001G060000g [Phaseolus vulgaris]ESW33317.1 hypothetical protein PHAVU_001G060000g [Phaseolus vulgaris]
MQNLQQKASEWSGVATEEAFAIDTTNLFHKLGLQTFINLSTNFYNRVYGDEEEWFRSIFADSEKENAIQNQYEFFVQRMGGPPLFSQRRASCGKSRLEKGLRFKHGEKFSANHKGTNKPYFLIQMDEEVDNGTLTRGAIRFMRFINGIKIQTLTRFLRLHVHKAPQFKVVVRNGDHLECEGQVKHIPVNIQGHCLIVLAYFLSIVAVEIVLGTQCQKNEIERIVVGIVQSSSSPFFPFHTAGKKERWNLGFCANYRALNVHEIVPILSSIKQLRALTEPFAFETDASSIVIGDVLMISRQCKVSQPIVYNTIVENHTGLWFWKGKLSIPSHSTIKKITLEEFHDSPVGGHAGFPRTLAHVSTQFCGNPILWQGVIPKYLLDDEQEQLSPPLDFEDKVSFMGKSYDAGHPALIGRHRPFPVTHQAAERWLHHMQQALDSTPDIDDDSKTKMMNFFRHTAYFLVAGDELKNKNNQQIPCKHAAKRDD